MANSKKAQSAAGQKLLTSKEKFWMELQSIVKRCKPHTSGRQRAYDQVAWNRLHKMLSPWVRSYYVSRGVRKSSKIEEFSEYFIAWLSIPGRLDSYNPDKGSLYTWLLEALKKAYADFCKEADPHKLVTVSVSTKPDLTALSEDSWDGIEERLTIKAKPTGGFTLAWHAWHGSMSPMDRDNLIGAFETERDRKAILRLFQNSCVPQFESLPEIYADTKTFGETVEREVTETRIRWRQLLQYVPLPLRTRFVTLHHETLGPFDEEEVTHFEMEFDLAYSEVKTSLNSNDRNVILDILDRSKEWGYQVDHRVNERILLELFKSRGERIPLSFRVAFISINHKMLGPLLSQEEIAEFQSQFGTSYDEMKSKLNVAIRKKILETLGRSDIWAKRLRDQVESLVKDKRT